MYENAIPKLELFPTAYTRVEPLVTFCSLLSVDAGGICVSHSYTSEYE